MNNGDHILWKYSISHGIFTSVGISEDGKYIVTTHTYGQNFNHGQVSMFNHDGILLWTYDDVGNSVDDCSISADGQFSAIWDGEDSVYLLNNDGQKIWQYDISGSNLGSVAISDNGQFIVVCDGSRNIYLLNQQGQLLGKYDLHQAVHGRVAISGDGQNIALGDGTKKVLLLNNEGKILWEYTADGYERFNSVSLSRDGQSIAIEGVYNQSSVILLNWDGKIIRKFPTDLGTSDGGVALSADSKYITAWNGEFNIKFYSRDGEFLSEYHPYMGGTTNSVNRVALSADGKYIATAGYTDLYLFSTNIQIDQKDIPTVIPTNSPNITAVRITTLPVLTSENVTPIAISNPTVPTLPVEKGVKPEDTQNVIQQNVPSFSTQQLAKNGLENLARGFNVPEVPKNIMIWANLVADIADLSGITKLVDPFGILSNSKDSIDTVNDITTVIKNPSGAAVYQVGVDLMKTDPLMHFLISPFEKVDNIVNDMRDIVDTL